jgi:hypothetical protein
MVHSLRHVRRFGARTALTRRCYRETPILYRLLGGVVAVERRRRAVRLSGGIYRIWSEAGRMSFR